MSMIELERWKPSETDPRRLEYAGQRKAQEVFQELKHRLESMGCLPDEYFLMDAHWENGREVPQDADVFCTVDYGGSEGVYVDVYLKWYENGGPITKSFITGKTLGENGNDLDRMFLVASAITKAFHGDHAAHARYMRIGGVEDTGGRVVHLSQQEEEVIIQALVEQREHQENSMSRTEQLLRRMTGSITGYMDLVGQRPLWMSDYDRTVLAIRDGELAAFKELYPKALDHADELLIEAAGRPGAVGRQMTSMLLDGRKDISYPTYCTACKRAIDIDDPEKALFLLHWAEHCVEKLEPSFYGDMASYAHSDHRYIARTIIGQCSQEQIAAAPSRLLEQFAMDGDYRTLYDLVDKGISTHGDAERTLHMLTHDKRNRWTAMDLLEKRMWVDPEDYAALHACVQNGAVDVAKLLLDGGMDFDGYRQWVQEQRCAVHEDTLQALEEHWSKMQAEMEQDSTQETGGMTLA